MPPDDAPAEPSQADLRAVNEQLLLASLRERELAEQLRHQWAERAAILEQVSEGILLTDAQGRITYVNAAARRLYGTAELDVPIARYTAAYHLLTLAGEPVPPEELALARAVRRRETVLGMRLLVRRPDGSEIVVEGSATPVLAADGTLLSAILLCRDVTAQQALEQQKEDFFAAAAHDLQTPLTVIRGNVQLLLRQVRRAALAPDRLIESLQQVEAAATRMERLIHNLLDLTRLQMGQALALQREPTDLVALSQRVVVALQGPGEERRIQVTGATAALIGSWDHDRLERVLTNLLANALKFSPRGSAIHLTLSREEGEAGRPDDRAPRGAWAVWRLQDGGIGIPASELPRIFERFRRGSNVPSRIAGTGIGLASAKQIIEQHGGTLTISSREGVSTTVTVRLPLAADQA